MSNSSTHVSLPIDKISFDEGNPRIKRFLAFHKGPITPEMIELALDVSGKVSADEKSSETGPSIVSLKEAIRASDGIINPIQVNKIDEENYVVIEGNTRLLIYKKFHKSGVEGNWENIPSIVYDNLEQTGIEKIRLQSHLVGPRQWDAYSKGKYLHDLWTKGDMSMERLVEFCGGRKREVIGHIDAYKDMEEFYRPVVPSEADFDISRYSSFREVQATRIKSAISEAGFTMTDFSKWIHDQLLITNAQVRQLPQILRNDEARGIFLKDGAEAANISMIQGLPGQTVTDAQLKDLCLAVLEKIKRLSWQDIKSFRGGKRDDDVQVIDELIDNLNELSNDITPDED